MQQYRRFGTWLWARDQLDFSIVPEPPEARALRRIRVPWLWAMAILSGSGLVLAGGRAAEGSVADLALLAGFLLVAVLAYLGYRHRHRNRLRGLLAMGLTLLADLGLHMILISLVDRTTPL